MFDDAIHALAEPRVTAFAAQDVERRNVELQDRKAAPVAGRLLDLVAHRVVEILETANARRRLVQGSSLQLPEPQRVAQ